MNDQLAELERRRRAALAMGGPERVERQHAAGRQTVRERIALLADPDSFLEIGLLAESEMPRPDPVPADAIVTGFAKVAGRPVCLIGVDATVMAGSTAPTNMRKQDRMVAFAGQKGIPLIVLADADGGRMPDVMGWRFSGLPFDFRTFLQAPAGHPAVPRCCLVLGPSFGDAALHAASAHFVVMTETSSLALSGPTVVASATGEEVTEQELGGSEASAAGGLAHLVVGSEPVAVEAARAFLSYLPDSAAFVPDDRASSAPTRNSEELLRIVPVAGRRAYDMRHVVEAIVDAGSAFPLRSRNAKNLLTVLCRIEGRVAGIVANQPLDKAGVLDDRSLAKELQFVDLCDTFNIPLVFLHDVPGLMVGSQSERAGIVAAYERIAARIATCHVPRVGVIIRKSYGGGNYAMGGRPTRPDFLFAWPTAELGFMAPETGVRTVYRRRLEEAMAAGGTAARDRLEAEFLAQWRQEGEPWEAAAHGYLDDVIDPRQTRQVISRSIEFAWGSRRPPFNRGGR